MMSYIALKRRLYNIVPNAHAPTEDAVIIRMTAFIAISECVLSISSVTSSSSMARQPYMGLGLLVSSRFHGHTHLRHTTVGRTPLDE
jgi:hypothetical protein